MAELLIADLYRALLQDKPKGEIPGWLPKRQWVLSRETVRAIAAQQGQPLGDDYDYDATDGVLLGLPFRVDDAVEGFALEPLGTR